MKSPFRFYILKINTGNPSSFLLGSAIPVSDRPIQLLVALSFLVNIAGLFTPVMGPDGALYASISKTMVLNHNYTDLLVYGKDWLDKPHFPFWAAAISFKLFGINTWSYKLPALIFSLAAAYYTWRLAKELYDKTIADWSTVILLTSQHFIISNNDVRAEPYLTGMIIASVYYYYKAYKTNRSGYLVAGSFFSALAVMTKGLFALVPVFCAITGGVAGDGNWKKLFQIKWLLAILIVAIFITPELAALWIQFGSHPEKLIFGKSGTSVFRFFFWDSQFGRFTNTGPIKGTGNFFFFFHTLLWAFSPWVILLYGGILNFIIKRNRDNIRYKDFFTFSGALFPFLMFSLSSFQLAHYTNILFPFFSIISARWMLSIRKTNPLPGIFSFQIFFSSILITFAILLNFFFHPPLFLLWAILISFIYIITIIKETKIINVKTILTLSAITSITLNLYLNTIFYPVLLKYQAGSEAAFYINKEFKKQSISVIEDTYSYSFYYNLKDSLNRITLHDLNSNPDMRGVLLYIPSSLKSQIKRPYAQIKVFKDYPVSKLSFEFINYETRGKTLRNYCLIRIL